MSSLGYAKLCSLFAWLLFAFICAFLIGCLEIIKGKVFDLGKKCPEKNERSKINATKVEEEAERWVKLPRAQCKETISSINLHSGGAEPEETKIDLNYGYYSSKLAC